jgi:ATP-binding cassette, subfamily B, bacterial
MPRRDGVRSLDRVTAPGSAQVPTVRALRRLGPYVRPVRWVLLVAGLSTMLAQLCGLTIPLIMQRILDGPVAAKNLSALPWLVGLVVLLGTAEAAFNFGRRRLVAGPTTRIEARMRADLYHRLQQLPVAFHDGWPSGQLLSRAVSDLNTIRQFLAFVMIYLIVNCVTIVVGLVVLFTIAPLFGLIAVCAYLPMALICTGFESKFRVISRLSQDQVGDLATTVEESVLGIRVLKAFGRGPDLVRRFTRQAAELRGTELRKARVLALLWGAIIALPELALGCQLLFGGLGVAGGTMTLGTAVAALTVTAYLRWPTDMLGWLLAQTNQAGTACARYWEVRDAERTVADPPRPRSLPSPARGRVRLEGVRFSFPGADGEVLRGVDLELAPGETVALVGATGCGKTTLTALLPRLADVTGGRITVDGVDVREVPLTELRTAVACAFEEPVLFSASVRENVALGSPGVSDEQVLEALRVAQAEDFVAALPWGLDTRIGEQGLSLSGGQRQRLALARAVVGRPPVLVLDDPLSALDVHTEAEVERALRSVLRGVTALVVAHRPSTVLLADRVAVLSGGRITVQGTHRELLAENAGYRALLSTVDEELAAAVDAGSRDAEEVAR